jgi:hypothetical protein
MSKRRRKDPAPAPASGGAAAAPAPAPAPVVAAPAEGPPMARSRSAGNTPTGGPAEKNLFLKMEEEIIAARDGRETLEGKERSFQMIESNKIIIQDILKLVTTIFSSASIIKNPENFSKLMVNGGELCKNLGGAALNVLGICSTLGESVISLVNLVGPYFKSSYNNNGILLGIVLTVLIQNREVLKSLQNAVERTVAVEITSLLKNLNQLSSMIQPAGVRVIDILVDYLSAGPLIESVGDQMTGDYEKDLVKVQVIQGKLSEKRKADLEKLFDAANAEAAIKKMLEEKKTPAQKSAVHADGTQSQGAQGANGGRRSRRRTKRRGTKSKRKHAKKRTKRRRKHSRSTKKRHRKNKMKKRKTKRRRKMRGGGKWGTGSCPADYGATDGAATGGGAEGGQTGGRRKMRGGGKWGTGSCPADYGATDGAATDGAATGGQTGGRRKMRGGGGKGLCPADYGATDGAATDGAATGGAATDGAATGGAATGGAATGGDK